MEREIKFRAWDNFTQTMHKDVNPFRWDFVIKNSWSECLKNNGRGILGSGGTEAEFRLPGVSYTDLMQYTGLKDKNGVEIYEGDILKCFIDGKKVGENDVVEFKNGCFWLRHRNIPIYQFETLPNDEYAGEVEVIGNIYQNPGLRT